MNKKNIIKLEIILIIIIIVPIIIHIVKEKDLANLQTAIKDYDLETVYITFNKYPNDDRFIQETIPNILKITDEEITKLSDSNISNLKKLLTHIQNLGIVKKKYEIDSMYNLVDAYLKIRTIEDKIKVDGYIECYKYLMNYKYLTNYQYSFDDSIITKEVEIKKEKLKDGFIKEATAKVKECIEEDDLYRAYYFLKDYYSCGYKEINQLYDEVQNKIAERPQEQNDNDNVIKVGMTQQEIIKICGDNYIISNKGNLKARNKGIFGAHDEFWYYTKQKLGIYFLNGKVVGISAYNPNTKMNEPVSVLAVP